jgi:TonB family protein
MLWSRGADTEPAPTRSTRNQVDLEALIEGLTVFSADQVTNPAELVNGAALDVRYPQDLFAEGVGGTVVAEFVVDTSGRIEKQTFSIVSATNSRFTAAVERAMETLRYTPASKDGRPVRQAVQQSFSFVRNPQKMSQVSKRSNSSR